MALAMLQLHGLRVISVVTGNVFYRGKKASDPADLTSLYCLMTDTISTYKCRLAEEKLLVLVLVLLIPADLQRNLANGSCCN